MFEFLGNRKKRLEQEQWASDTLAVYGELVAQLEALSGLKERNEDRWPADLDLIDIKRNMIPAGKRALELIRAIKSAKKPIDEQEIVELQTIAGSLVKTKAFLGEKTADLVVSELTREALTKSGGFGRKSVS